MGSYGEYWCGRTHSVESKRKISISRSSDGNNIWLNNIFKDGILVDSATTHYTDLKNIHIECIDCGKLVFFKGIRRNRHITKEYFCRSCAHKNLPTWNTGLANTNHPGILKIGKASKKYWNDSDAKKKHRLQMEARGHWTPLSAKTKWQQYKQLCWMYTNQNDLSSIENYDRRVHTTGGSGYTLDHMFSIFEGFKRGIVPWIIGSIVNLQCISCTENSVKNKKCSISEKELYERYDRLSKGR